MFPGLSCWPGTPMLIVQPARETPNVATVAVVRSRRAVFFMPSVCARNLCVSCERSLAVGLFRGLLFALAPNERDGEPTEHE